MAWSELNQVKFFVPKVYWVTNFHGSWRSCSECFFLLSRRPYHITVYYSSSHLVSFISCSSLASVRFLCSPILSSLLQEEIILFVNWSYRVLYGIPPLSVDLVFSRLSFQNVNTIFCSKCFMDTLIPSNVWNKVKNICTLYSNVNSSLYPFWLNWISKSSHCSSFIHLGESPSPCMALVSVR